MASKRTKKLIWLATAGIVVAVPTLVCCVRGPGLGRLTGGAETTLDRGAVPEPTFGTEDAPLLQSPSASGFRPPLGTNLASPSYWSASHPFVDAMKATGHFISGRPDHPNPERQWDDGAELSLDAHGWVRSLRPGQVARVFVLAGDIPYPSGRYTVLYEGSGEIEYQGDIQNRSDSPGRVTFDLGPGPGLFLNITRIDPEDPLRNIRILFPGGRCSNDGQLECREDADCAAGARCAPFEETYEQEPFHPGFLADVRRFGTLRFMDWMETNRERDLVDGEQEPMPISSYSEWPTRAHAHWHPMPFDVMIDLSNLLGADPWLTIPHQADDDFVRRLAVLVRDRLSAGLKVYVEYSNEHWNDIFDQHQWINAQGCSAYSDSARSECDPNGDGTLCEYTSWNRYQEKCAEYGSKWYARRTVEVMRIFEQVFGDTLQTRVVRVLAGQIGALEWRGVPQLDHPWDGSEPTHRHIDAYAVAPYFGGEELGAVDEAFELVTEETHGAPAGTYALLSGHPDAEHGGLHQWIQTDVRALAEREDLRRIRLIAYEGGQHFFSHDEATRTRMHAANRDPRMKELYLQYLTMWSQLTGGGVLVHFTSPAAWGAFGSWGSKEHQGQPRAEAPKHDALETFIERARAAAEEAAAEEAEPSGRTRP